MSDETQGKTAAAAATAATKAGATAMAIKTDIYYVDIVLQMVGRAP